MNKIFWNVKDGEKTAELIIDGEIATYGWWGDEVTPKKFAKDLAKVKGKDLTVWINSPGGDVFAGSCIYTMLMEHDKNVTVKITGLAASAASVIAMAGTEILMSPTSMMMIHNPWTVAIGDAAEMEKVKSALEECKESIINAYELKTGLSREELSELMDDTTWMSAKTAIEKGFVDGMLYAEKNLSDGNKNYLSKTVFNSILNLQKKPENDNTEALKSKLKLLSL